jgi:hypothetical protein
MAEAHCVSCGCKLSGVERIACLKCLELYIRLRAIEEIDALVQKVQDAKDREERTKQEVQ